MIQKEHTMQRVTGLWKSGRNGKIIIVVGASLFLCLCCVIIGLLSPKTGQTPNQNVDVSEIQTATVLTIVAETEKTEIASIPTNTPKPTNTTAPTETPIPSATPNPNLVDSGTYLVNTDIKPGIYKGYAFGLCYWARLKNLTGALDSIIANANAQGQFYVEIKSTDTAFQTKCPIERLETLPPPVAEFPKTISAGMYLVNIDIRPGTYKGNSDRCYWEREANVAGGFDAILSNGNTNGQFYVQVLPSDFALKVGCDLEWVSE
jgi:hypothetical protein